MALDNAKNFAKVTVSTGYNASANSIVLQAGHGAKLPTAPFNVTWWNATDYADPADDPNVEIGRVTNISTDTLTVTRGREGTVASTKNTSGKTYKMIAGLTAEQINSKIAGLSKPLVGYYTATGASSITISGLGIDTDEGYELVVRYKCATTTQDNLGLRFNGVTSTTNYYNMSQGFYKSIASGPARNDYQDNSSTFIQLTTTASIFQQARVQILRQSAGTGITLAMYQSGGVGGQNSGNAYGHTTNGMGSFQPNNNITSITVIATNGTSGDWDVWLYRTPIS